MSGGKKGHCGAYEAWSVEQKQEVGPYGLPMLAKNRIKKLEEIGFQWEVSRQPVV